MICDAASVSCMIERVGFRNSRWQQIKRKEFFKGTISIQNMMESELDGTLQAESSLSSASSADSSCSSSAGETPTKRDHHTLVSDYTNFKTGEAKRVTSSSESNNGHSEAATRKTDDSDSSAARNIAKASFSTAIEAATWNEPSQRTKRQKGSHSFQTAKIAQSGGVVHEVVSQPMNMTLHANFELAPSGFTGASNLIMSTVDLLSNNVDEIGANYAVNKDDMIMIDDVLMCPFVFRSKNAVLCGALTDCVMPGMLRANFNKANKLTSLELIYDAMGFMQQLDGASGGEVAAQVIPGSLEMALVHGTSDARVVTEAKPPFCVVHVNEPWTRLTKYSQLEVEGRGLLSLIEGEGTDPEARVRPGKPHHKFEDVAKGRCACSTNIHNDKFGNPFVDFMCSYPLTK